MWTSTVTADCTASSVRKRERKRETATAENFDFFSSLLILFLFSRPCSQCRRCCSRSGRLFCPPSFQRAPEGLCRGAIAATPVSLVFFPPLSFSSRIRARSPLALVSSDRTHATVSTVQTAFSSIVERAGDAGGSGRVCVCVSLSLLFSFLRPCFGRTVERLREVLVVAVRAARRAFARLHKEDCVLEERKKRGW